MFAALLQNLQEQIKVYEDILRLSEEKTEVISKADIQRLDEMTQQEWKYLKEAERLELVRMELLGDNQEYATLSGAINACTGEKKEQLKHCKDALLTLIMKQKDVNEINHRLLESHLDYSEFMMNVFSQATQANNMYNQNGYEQSQSNSTIGLIDSEV